MPIVDAVSEEFKRSYHLHYFPDVRSLVEPVPRIEEIQRVYCSNERSHAHSILTHRKYYCTL